MPFSFSRRSVPSDVYQHPSSRSLEPWNNARSTLLEKLAELPCLLAQCDTTDCLALNLTNNSLTIRPYIPVLGRLLESSAEDAGSDLRRRVYQVLLRAFKHHNPDEMADMAVDMVFKGMNDPDRSVRVSAG